MEDATARRRSDRRPPRTPTVAPTPGGLGSPDPAGFERSLDLALEASRRARQALTLVLIELGEAAPPETLVAVADVVRRSVRSADVMWRRSAGGLGVLLTDTDGPSAEPVLARVRLRLRGPIAGAVGIGRAAAAPGIGAAALVELARGDMRPLQR